MKKTIALIFTCATFATATQAQQRPGQTPEQQAAQKAQADATQADRNDMMKQLGITAMRPPRSGSDHANSMVDDEACAAA